MKIKNDKYYTPKDLAKYLINKTIEIIGTNNITDIIEPSAGNGASNGYYSEEVDFHKEFTDLKSWPFCGGQVEDTIKNTKANPKYFLISDGWEGGGGLRREFYDTKEDAIKAAKDSPWAGDIVIKGEIIYDRFNVSKELKNIR